MSGPPNYINVTVTIAFQDGGYIWSYSGDVRNTSTGLIKLPNYDPAQITYTLCPETAQKYSFCFVNTPQPGRSHPFKSTAPPLSFKTRTFPDIPASRPSAFT
jgi:hypothetical protein